MSDTLTVWLEPKGWANPDKVPVVVREVPWCKTHHSPYSESESACDVVRHMPWRPNTIERCSEGVAFVAASDLTHVTPLV